MRKAVKTSLLLENKIEFSDYKVGEEAIYSFLVLWKSKSFSFINKPVYEYLNRVGSQSDLPMSDSWGMVALALKEKIIEMNLYPIYANTVNAFIVMSTIISLNKMTEKKTLKEYLTLAKTRGEKFRKDIDLKYPIDFQNLDKRALILYPFLKLRWFVPIYYISYFRKLFR